MLTILPVGGLGAIGMNCMLLGVDDDLVMIDCGSMVPGSHEPGVASVLPDMDLLLAHKDRIRAIVLTHGHEDHIGALPRVLRHLDVPIYGTRFTLGLVRERLSYNHVEAKGGLHLIAPGSQLPIGPMTFSFIRVTHSIPDAVALAINTPAGTIVHTGDFRIDPTPVDGQPTDEAALRALGDEGVLLLLSDSTNATVPGHTRHEATVTERVAEVIRDAPGRVLVGMFSSNVHRSTAIMAAARAAGRKVATAGQAMGRYLDLAERQGGVELGPILNADQTPLAKVEDDKLVIICTGSQGEPRGALRRIARGEHRTINIRQGDTLVLSARAIPGNEFDVHRLADDFIRGGARVIHGDSPLGIHGSGHAAEDELRAMLSWLRPRFFVPVHGTFGFMSRHAELAREAGVDQTLVAVNGQRLAVSADGVTVEEVLSCQPWYAVGDVIGDAQTAALRQRRELAWQGAVAVYASWRDGGWQVAVKSHGVVFAPHKGPDALAAALEHALARGGQRHDEAEIGALLKRVSRAFLKGGGRQRPPVLAFIDAQGGPADGRQTR